MMRRHNHRLFAAAMAGMILLLTACDDGLTRGSLVSYPNDPPNILVVAGGKLVSVRFNDFGTGYTVTPLNTFQVLGPAFSPFEPLSSERSVGPRPGGEFGGGPTDPFTDPDPDEHDFDPDLWPEPDDDPFADPPLPLPDFPDEDPFDGLPDPPPFDVGDLNMSNLTDGSMSSSGSTAAGQDGSRAAQAEPRAAAINRIQIGARPIGMKISPDKKRIYVAYAQGIAVVDRAAGAVVDRITLPPEARPHSVAVSRDGKKLYVTSYLSSSAQVYVVDLSTKNVIATVPVGGFPSGIAVTPDGTQVWATSFFSGNVTVIDTLTNARMMVIPGLSAAWGVRFNPTGTRAYVTSSENVGASLRVLDTSTYKEIANIPTGNYSRSIGVTPSGRHVFVTNAVQDTIIQIDAVNNKVIRTIKVGARPQGFQFVP